jgi:hypothetical protein
MFPSDVRYHVPLIRTFRLQRRSIGDHAVRARHFTIAGQGHRSSITAPGMEAFRCGPEATRRGAWRNRCTESEMSPLRWIQGCDVPVVNRREGQTFNLADAVRFGSGKEPGPCVRGCHPFAVKPASDCQNGSPVCTAFFLPRFVSPPL